MPNASVSINCPACKRSLKLAQEPPQGARLRCPYSECGTVFRYAPGQSSPPPAAEGPVAPPEDQGEYDLMNDLLADDEGLAASGSAPVPVMRGQKRAGTTERGVDADAPLPRLGRSMTGSRKIRQPVPGHPLAQASESSKDVLIGGKGVRFNEPRTYVGVLIGVIILAAGYGGFVAFGAFWKYYSNVSEQRANDLTKKVKAADVAKKQKFEAAVAKVRGTGAAPAPAPSASTPAPGASSAPSADTGGLTVAVESVRQGALFPPDQREFFELKLKITNESKVAGHTVTWSGPKVTARLRGSSFELYQCMQPPSQDTKIASGQSIYETLYFERTIPGRELTVELTIPGSAMPTKKFTIQPGDVKRGSG
jgi:hypothetical protein